MTHRIGECSSCGATYKLPASFAADRARCKSCGGVVEIAPAEGSAPPVPAVAPAKAAAPAPAPAPKPKPKREGPSMKERLIAARKAEAEKAPAAAKPAAKRSAAKPAAKPAARAGSASPRASAAVKPTAAKAGAHGSRGSTPARSRRGGSRRTSDDEDEEGGGGRRHGRREKKKASLVPAMLGLVALLAVAGGATWFLMNPPTEDDSTGEVSAADKAEGTSDAPISLEDGDAAIGATAGEDEAQANSEEAGAEGEGSDAESTDEAATEAAAATKPVKKAPAGDPASVDLDAIPDYGPIAGCSEERFAELNQLAATMMDPMAGAAGNRAKIKLEEAGKESFPSILNAMKKLDLSTEDGFRAGDVSQNALQNICNGANFGWKYLSQEPDTYHYFDKLVIRSWCRAWDQAKDSDKAWAKLAKLDKVDSKPAEEEPDDEEELDELDGLDDM